MFIFKIVSIILGCIVCFFMLIYLVLIGSGQVYISGEMAMHVAGMADDIIWSNTRNLGLPFFKSFGPISVEVVGFFHAIRNGIFLVCFIILLVLVIPVGLVLVIFATIVSAVTANIEIFVASMLGILGLCLIVPCIPFGAFFIWIGLLFQPLTPAYFIIWFFSPILLIVLEKISEWETGSIFSSGGGKSLVQKKVDNQRYKFYSGANWLDKELKGRVDDKGNIYSGTNWLIEEKIGRINKNGNIYRGNSSFNEQLVGRVDEKGNIHKGTNWLNEEKMGRVDESGNVYQGKNWLDEKQIGRFEKDS